MAIGSVMVGIHERLGILVILGRAKIIVTREIPVTPELSRRIDQIVLANTWTAVETKWRLEMLAPQTYRLARDNRNESGGREILGQTDPKTDRMIRLLRYPRLLPARLRHLNQL